jgi:flagellar M-ring protein FliF
MSSYRPNFVNQVRDIWSRLLWPRRLTIIIGFAFGGLACLGASVHFMNRVEYRLLTCDLNPEDAQAITAKLQEQKKHFIVQRGCILVAASPNEAAKLWLDISGAGLGRSGRIGFEIFDKDLFGMTDSTKQVNLYRAIEGEIERTIESLSEISQAHVHIPLPNGNKGDIKASVVLSLKKNAELSKSSVAGIRGLVAGAVPGLHTYNVSIVVNAGRLLSRSLESGDGARSEQSVSNRQ